MVPFDNVTNLVIRGKEYPVKGLACRALGEFKKKRKWVRYSGRAFFDWGASTIKIPTGVEVNTDSIATDLALWEDYDGEIPPQGDLAESRLARGFVVITDIFDENLPVPNLDLLSPGERIADAPPKPAGHESAEAAIDAAVKNAAIRIRTNRVTGL
jgi:hypothetical protein